jgi:uncharacterized protein (DUF2461 family)
VPPLVDADVYDAALRQQIGALVAGVQQLREDVEEARRADRRRTLERARKLARLAAQRATPSAGRGRGGA